MKIYFYPKYWLTWFGLGLLRLSVYLPYRFLLILGRVIGSLMRICIPKRANIARCNIALCFPQLSAIEKEALLRKHFHSLGIAIFETALAWWANPKKLNDKIKITGISHLQNALAANNGVILFASHFTTLEIGAALINAKFPIHAMYRPQKNLAFDYVMRKARQRVSKAMIPRNDLRATLRALRKNEIVWYAPDQDHGIRHAVFVDFFNQPAAMIVATSRLAKISNAKIIPFTQRRLANAEGYELILEPALTNFPSGDDKKDTQHLTSIIESWILQAPEQYLWTHRRFKTRPQGLPKVY